jgi:hypothetical protein
MCLYIIVVQAAEKFTYHMLCDVCGEDLGPQKMYWAEEHLKKYPTHRRGFTY